MRARWFLEVACSVGASLALGSMTMVPLVITASRVWEPPDDVLIVDASTDDDGAPEEDDDWAPLPQRPQRVVAVTHAADPAEPAREEAPIAEAPPIASPPVIVYLPPAPDGLDIGVVPPVDPLAFLELGWGTEPDPTVDDPEDGAPEEIDDDGLADASIASEGGGRTRGARARAKRAASTRTTKPKPPCTDDNPGITEVSPGRYEINRGIVEYYATHPFEFENLATYVVTHKAPDGVPDGFKVGMKRCSVLWESGFRSGDVVNSVNTRTISTVMQAVGAYLALRGESEFDVVITRKGTTVQMHYTLLEETREERRERRDTLRKDRREARAEKRADHRVD